MNKKLSKLKNNLIKELINQGFDIRKKDRASWHYDNKSDLNFGHDFVTLYPWFPERSSFDERAKYSTQLSISIFLYPDPDGDEAEIFFGDYEHVEDYAKEYKTEEDLKEAVRMFREKVCFYKRKPKKVYPRITDLFLVR